MLSPHHATVTTSTVKAAVREKRGSRPALHSAILLGSPNMKETLLFHGHNNNSNSSNSTSSNTNNFNNNIVNNHVNSINNNNNNLVNSNPPSEFIVDHSTRTTYLKGRFLGKGGFARVHELTDLTTNKVYAGKIIPKNRITKPHHREKIIREIELHQTLKHENIVQFHHFFEDNENVYIILENCSLKSLVHVLKHRRYLSEPEVRYYMRQLIAGVQYIHSQKVIHRDLKLGNMFLSEDLVVKIGDFGLAARVQQTATEKITICGTPNYIAPEVLNKKGHGYEADVWAIGCIMYAMLVGQPPFETSTLKDTYARIATNQYVIPPLISPDARSLITELLHPEPNQRIDLGEALQHRFFCRGHMPVSLPPSSCTILPKFPTSTLNSRSANVSPEISAHPSSLTSELRKFSRTVSQLCLSGSRNETKLNNAKDKLEPKVLKKESSLHNTIRQKLNSVLGTGKKSKPLTASLLYQHLSNGLEAMVEDCPSRQNTIEGVNILFVTKWIDYSNKYGFGYQLSDQSIGVLFNDGSKIGFTPDRSRVEFYECDGKMIAYPSSNVPVLIQDHFTLLKYFAKYMDENLTDGGTSMSSENKRVDLIPMMQRWVRTTKAIIMQLNSGMIQVNFFKDHTKVIVNEENQELLVTFIDENRESNTFQLSCLIEHGCPRQLYQRLLYVLGMLRDFAQLETGEV